MLNIPRNAGTVTGWKTLPIKENFEPLVPIGPFASDANAIVTSSVYFGEHDNSPYTGKQQLAGSLRTIFVRKGVAKRLEKAQQLLPEGYRLLVFDAYRPLKVQQSLFRFYRDQLRAQHPEMSMDACNEATQTYVSIPTSDPARPSPHNTGGSVDLVIVKLPPEQAAALRDIDEQLARDHMSPDERLDLEMQRSAIVRQHAEMLNFGTAFDHGGERAAIAYFEEQLAAGHTLSKAEIEAAENRRLLYEVMTKAGMQAYAAEWWHFNAPESQMGAKVAGLTTATYGAATFAAKNLAHEKFRQNAYDQMLQVQNAHELRAVAKPWPVEVMTPHSD